LPELAVRQLDETRKKQIRNFISPTPVREISLIYYKKFSKQRLNNIIKKEISEKTKEFLPITLEKDMEIVSIY
jgi:ribosomal protein S3AE